MASSSSILTEQTDRYGLIGYPLGHSFSARYFNDFFAQAGLNAHYEAFPMPSVAELRELLKRVPRLRGLNVTSPHKEAVLPLLTSLSPVAKRVGAVNAIAICTTEKGETKLIGHNTDVAGFTHALRPLLSEELPKRALILGTGGASKAVAVALEALGIAYDFVSRSRRGERIRLYQDLSSDELANDYPLIINATPLGMGSLRGELPPITLEGIGEEHLCYDLVYNPSPTRFLEECARRGARTSDGLTMLYAQADEAWRFWQSAFSQI